MKVGFTQRLAASVPQTQSFLLRWAGGPRAVLLCHMLLRSVAAVFWGDTLILHFSMPIVDGARAGTSAAFAVLFYNDSLPVPDTGHNTYGPHVEVEGGHVVLVSCFIQGRQRCSTSYVEAGTAHPLLSIQIAVRGCSLTAQC